MNGPRFLTRPDRAAARAIRRRRRARIATVALVEIDGFLELVELPFDQAGGRLALSRPEAGRLGSDLLRWAEGRGLEQVVDPTAP